MKRPIRWLVAGTLLLALGACSSMLPKGKNESTSFKTFDEVREAVESLTPMRSDLNAMRNNGFDPIKHPNTVLLTHADVVRRFVPTSLLRREDLNPGILACLEARDACRGLEFQILKIERVREGNFFADFFNFRRQTRTTGWRFNAQILLVNDLVVYRNWGGQPDVRETEVRRNPLGPFQDIGPSTVNSR